MQEKIAPDRVKQARKTVFKTIEIGVKTIASERKTEFNPDYEVSLVRELLDGSH